VGGEVKYRFIRLGPLKLDERQKHGVTHYYAMLVDNNKYSPRGKGHEGLRDRFDADRRTGNS
jgi:hypothetical protein